MAAASSVTRRHQEVHEHDANSSYSSKENDILNACADKDITALRHFAKSPGGLISDLARQAAWPILLGCSGADDQQPDVSWQSLPRHKDEEQVALDVDRSFVYYPKDDTEKRTGIRKSQLSDVIVAVLRRHPFLNYFQGYHDIAQVFLLVLGATAAVPAVERLSLLRIRDFMLPTMTASISHLSLLPAILAAADPELHRHLLQTAPFYFALPATLTLYAHDIQEYGDIARLFDYLLASEAVISIYFFAMIICSRKTQLLELEPNEHDMLHATLSKLPKPLDLDALISKTDSLFTKCPPERLRGFAWYGISHFSVLKTARHPAEMVQRSLNQGEILFQKHAHEVRRQDSQRATIQQLRHLGLKYRRPAVLFGSSVFIVLISLYLARDSTIVTPQRLMRTIGGEWGRLLSALKPS